MTDNERALLRMLTETAQEITDLKGRLQRHEGIGAQSIRDFQKAQRDEEYRALVLDRDEWKSAAKMGAEQIAELEKERDEHKQTADDAAKRITELLGERRRLEQTLDSIQIALLSAYDGDASNAATAEERLLNGGVLGLANHIKTSLLTRANRVRELEEERDALKEATPYTTEGASRLAARAMKAETHLSRQMAENDSLKAENAALTADIAMLRAENASLHGRPGDPLVHAPTVVVDSHPVGAVFRRPSRQSGDAGFVRIIGPARKESRRGMPETIRIRARTCDSSGKLIRGRPMVWICVDRLTERVH